MDRLRWSVLAAASIFVAIAASQPPAQSNNSVAITNALIRTQSDQGDFVGTIVIRDGKVAALGRDIAPPQGAVIIDGTGCTVTPGLIDAHGTLGLNSAAAGEGGRDAALNILDAVDPFNDDWHAAARQGVTAVYVQPSGSGNLGGSGAVLRVCGAECADSMSLRSPASIQMALGIPPAARVGQGPQLPEGFGRRGPPIQLPAAPPAAAPSANSLTRYAQFEQVRAQWAAAKAYGEGKPNRREPAKELLLRAIKGEIPVRVEVYYEDDVQNAMKLATEFGLKLQFERTDRVGSLPAELSTVRSNLVLGPFASGRISPSLRALALDGRGIAIGTFGVDPRSTAGLRLQAASAVSTGVPRERVLHALTRGAAELLGIDDRAGRISVGRIADLAVFAGDPLDPSVSVRLTISQGTITHESPIVEKAIAATPVKFEVPAQLPSSYVVRTTRLLTSSGEFAAGELFIVSGRISSRPTNAESLPVIDVGNAPVSPGLVAAHVSSATEIGPDADAAHIRAVDSMFSEDSRMRSFRDAGFLRAVASPGSGNVLAGMTGLYRGEAAVDVAQKFVLTAAARNSERYPISLSGQVQLIEDRLRMTPAETNLFVPEAVALVMFAQRDQAMQSVRERRVAALFEVQTRAEVRAALRLIGEHNLRGILAMPREVGDLASEIRQAGVGVVVGAIRPQDADRIVQGLVALGKSGVPIAFGAEPAEMRSTAAWLANAGVPRSVVRRALMSQPEEAFGLPAGSSRLQQGDSADFVVWSGDPLDTSSRVVAVVIQGQRVVLSGGDDASTSSERRAIPATGRTGRRGR
jgi:imidazolonepropionase-like amidohydrolase